MILNHLEITFLLLKAPEVRTFFWVEAGVLRLVDFAKPITVMLPLLGISKDFGRSGFQKPFVYRLELVGVMTSLSVTNLIIMRGGYVQDLGTDGLQKNKVKRVVRHLRQVMDKPD